MTVKENEARIKELEEQVKAIVHLHNRAACKIYDYARAMGPMWQTAEGFQRPLGLLSTEHLENLTNGRWLERLPDHGRYAQQELKRRKTDTDMRKKPNPFKGLFRKLFR